MHQPITHTTNFLGTDLTLETGRFATLADGAVLLTYGNNIIFSAVTISRSVREGMDFFPLLIEYQEKFYASGKIKNSKVNKREGRPADSEILKGRLIDRTLRPLFPSDMRNEVQVVINILATDGKADLSDLAMLAASTAIMQTGIPFHGPAAGIKIGMDNDGKLVPHSDYELDDLGKLELMVGGKKGAIMMVEAVAGEVSEETIVEALELAGSIIDEQISLQEEFLQMLPADAKPEIEIHTSTPHTDIINAVDTLLTDDILSQLYTKDKKTLNKAEEALKKLVNIELASKIEENNWSKNDIGTAVFKSFKNFVRKSILEKEKRLDSRSLDEIRPLSVNVGVLPLVHGSGHFRRGDTEALTIVTLGGPESMQYIEEIDKDYRKSYYHHYNMPGYSTGDVKMNRGASRREIGHGYIGERALAAVLPSKEDFPYTIRVVSELLTSNGSTSMAATCGSTLALMDAGVPIKKPVSGIAMGLVQGEDGTIKILSDIQGMEDFTGDMDFKVAGTSDGITALQMDIKVKGLSHIVLSSALAQAKIGRAYVLDAMTSVIAEPRAHLASTAPQIITISIRPDQIGTVIGSGGKNINNIIEVSGASIDIDDAGLVFVTAPNGESSDKAQSMIKELLYEPEMGEILEGKVVKILDFGAVVEFAPGKDGLLHISELEHRRVDKVEDIVKMGDTVKVKIIRIEGMPGKQKISLSRKALLD